MAVTQLLIFAAENTQRLNTTSWAVFITSVTGAVLGGLGWWSGRRRDTTAAENTAKDVATRASSAAVSALKTALDELQVRVTDQHETIVEQGTTIAAQGTTITAQGVEITALKRSLVRCEDQKAKLTKRVRELEKAR